MHLRHPRVLLAALGLGLAACSGESPTAPSPMDPTKAAATPALALPLPSVRLSEFHYDNAGTDAGESIEVSYPDGTDVSGYSVVLYNGGTTAAAAAAAVVYGTRTLAPGTGLTVTPCTAGGRSVAVLTYPANGIQNGNPDGIALVDPSGAVVEFLSYGGVMTAASGPAAGRTSEDVLAVEPSTAPIGSSIQRNGSDVWTYAAGTNTFGACNDEDTGPPPVPVATLTLAPTTATIAIGATQTLTATALDASGAAISAPALAWSSATPAVATVSATGIVTGVAEGTAVITATAASGVAATSSITVSAAPPPPPVGELPPVRFSELHYDNVGTDVNEALEVEGPAGTDLTGWSIVLYNGNGGASYNTAPLSGVLTDLANGRGTRLVCYPTDGVQNGSPDGFALVNAAGAVVEFLSYEGSFTATNGPAAGLTSTDIIATQVNAPLATSLQRSATGVWASAPSTYICPSSISFTGRTAFDAPLPVGFEDQIFATLRSSAGATVPTTITWTSDTPDIATIDANGVFRALAAGTAVLRATAADGTTNTLSLPTRVGVPSTTAIYEGNAEFGEPADADVSDDFIIRRREFTSSFNRVKNTPNWVSYNLEATHFGAEDRCDCFTYDPQLPASFFRYTTNDYTGSGAIAGFGIDRGHLARSFDRTSSSADNAASFLFTNIIPQAADQNQGPWATLENVLGDRARVDNREVYIVAGVAGNAGTLKNEGRIVIPAFTWKVAVILPRNARLADVRRAADLEIVSVVMPNVAGIRNVDWNTYRVTVDSVERLSGYDLLALLPDQIENAVESGTSAPVAAVDGPYAGVEGGVISLSGATSSDADNDALSFAWNFGDGTTSTGATTSHVYTQDGTFTVELTVTDARGLTDVITTTATIANVAPTVNPFAGTTILPGERYLATGSFNDPGNESWTAFADYGDGAGPRAAAVTGRTFALNNVYRRPGTFTVNVNVADDDASGTASASVTVITLAVGTQQAIDLVRILARDRELRVPGAVAIGATLGVAQRAFERGQTAVGLPLLRVAATQVDILVKAGRLNANEAAPLKSLLQRLIAAAQV